MTLAVLVPVLGAPTETFVRRHVTDLAPGETVVVSRRIDPAATQALPDVPVLLLDPLADSWGGDREQEAVRSFLDEHGVEVVLAEFLDVWLQLLGPLRDQGRRIWAHGHGYDLSSRLVEPWWVQEYAALKATEGVVVPSRLAAGRLAGLGLPRVEAVPYGVDVPDMPAVRDGAGCSVLAVGRLVPKKAPLAVLEAARRARVGLVLAGDGPLREQVQQAAGPNVVLAGAVAPARVAELMAQADIFVQHSVVDPETGDEEGLPVAILEAMAAALPVVATRHAGIPEAVLDGTTGLLVDEGDVDAMAQALARLAADPALRRRMGAAGWERARDHFSWPASRSRLRELLQLKG